MNVIIQAPSLIYHLDEKLSHEISLPEISFRSFRKYTREKQEGWEKQQMICQD